jgi:hypothetical protein
MGKQPKPVLIFRGSADPKRQCDERARESEAQRYDSDVCVMFQKKAWADLPLVLDWVEGPLADFAHDELGGAECLLFADKLTAQYKCDGQFSAAAKKAANATTVFGVANGSHIWQPVDHNIGAAYKRLLDDYY